MFWIRDDVDRGLSFLSHGVILLSVAEDDDLSVTEDLAGAG